MSVAVRYVALLSIVFLCGCQLFSGTTTKSQSTQSAENISAARDATIRKVTEGEKSLPYQFEVSGKNNKLELHLPPQPISKEPFRETLDYDEESAETAGSWTSWFSKYKYSIPMGLSICFIGIGILILFFAIRYARKSSVAVDAGFGLADQAIGQLINGVESKLAASTDPAENARLSNERAFLEKQRGKIATAKPK